MPFAFAVLFVCLFCLCLWVFAPYTLSKKDQCISNSLSPNTFTSPVFQKWTNALVTCEHLLKVFILHHFNISVAFLKFPFRLLLYLCWVQNNNSQPAILDEDFEAIGLLMVSLLSVCFYYLSKSLFFMSDPVAPRFSFLMKKRRELQHHCLGEVLSPCHLESHTAWFGAELNGAAFISHTLLWWCLGQWIEPWAFLPWCFTPVQCWTTVVLTCTVPGKSVFPWSFCSIKTSRASQQHLDSFLLVMQFP